MITFIGNTRISTCCYPIAKIPYNSLIQFNFFLIPSTNLQSFSVRMEGHQMEGDVYDSWLNHASPYVWMVNLSDWSQDQTGTIHPSHETSRISSPLLQNFLLIWNHLYPSLLQYCTLEQTKFSKKPDIFLK